MCMKMYVNFNCVNIKTVYLLAISSAIFMLYYLNNTSYKKTEVDASVKSYDKTTTNILKHKKKQSKFILLWTNSHSYPYVYFGEGYRIFKERKCKYTNCFVTGNRQLLTDYSKYDIVAFNGPQLVDVLGNDDMPRVRSPRQKYVYTNIEAAVNYPICSNTWDNFFNWTWTYKLNSDAVWGYMVVKNSTNHVVGPGMAVDWISEEDMAPIDEDVKFKLASKKKAVAWFTSNCNTMSKRENFVFRVENYMTMYNLNVDIYGTCGTFQCPKEIMHSCLDELERHYYFYFAFENAISEDYLTEKILHALNHYTVPIVYGGANYSRFLPPGSYINAYELGAQKLAKEMYDIIENPERYYRYFRWRKYYSVHFRHESPETDDYCRFCAMANDEDLMNATSVYSDFSSWWTSDKICKSLKGFK